MAFSTVTSAILQGLHVEMVSVEADVSNGLPMFHMVGYLSSEVKEASERVRTAIRNSGLELPPRKIVVNLSPATVRKKGASFDLPIALAVLESVGALSDDVLEGTMVTGELGLDGRVQKVAGILPMVLEAKEQGCHTCIIPGANAPEGALVEGIRIIGVESLKETYGYLTGTYAIAPTRCPKEGQKNWMNDRLADFSDIQGQEAVKRAAEVAVAGGHNLLLVGPPGSGKSMTARRIATILPPPSPEESMEMTKIYSVSGLIDKERPLIAGRPFRSVHHTTTKAALIGGGAVPLPGEISLAHGGVLFMDELAEFPRTVLEVLRQPLEERKIRLVRTHGNYEFPANFMLVAAMNPCPCGNYPDLEKCVCTPSQVQQYLGHVSQPFLDRIDICMETPKVPYEALLTAKKQETSAQIRERVCAAREIQSDRYRGTSTLFNAMLGTKEIQKVCRLGEKEERLMKRAFTSLGLTARTYYKILRVARTIADLEASYEVREEHLMEAVGYRTLDKKYWGR